MIQERERGSEGEREGSAILYYAILFYAQFCLMYLISSCHHLIISSRRDVMDRIGLDWMDWISWIGVECRGVSWSEVEWSEERRRRHEGMEACL